MTLTRLFFDFLAPYIRARLGRSQRGNSIVEYLLLVVFLAVLLIAAMTAFGGAASAKYNSSASTVLAS